MKKSLLALAALTAFAGVASAQSSVTAFGIVDLAARNVDNHSGSIKSLSSGGQATSRIGFRGIEDLGGGLRAGFWLESEVGPDTGAGGSTVGSATNVFWARRSTVSLMGSFGEVRLGRDFTPTYNSFGAVEIFGYVGVASPANLRGAFYANGQAGTATAVRNSNAISYFLPAMGGLTGQVQVTAGEGAANQAKSMSGRLAYATGPITLTGSWGQLEKQGPMTDDLTTWNLGMRYNLGFATIGGLYEESDTAVSGRSLKQKLATANITVPMGSGRFLAQYTETGGVGTAAAPGLFSSKMFGLGYVYNMSKRTSLYTNYGSINNSGSATTGARFTTTGSGPAVTRGGETSTGYEFGVRHDF